MNKINAIEFLNEVSIILAKYKIKYWLTDGTLLGFYREGDFISHDHDIDIGILFETFDTKCLDELSKISSISQLGYVEDSLELQLKNSKKIKIDLFFFYKEGNKLRHSAFNKFDKNKKGYYRIDYYYEFFETKKTIFLGRNFNVPIDPLNFIITKYGKEWKKPNKKWKYDYSPKNHVKTNIFIDENLSNLKFKKWLEKE